MCWGYIQQIVAKLVRTRELATLMILLNAKRDSTPKRGISVSKGIKQLSIFIVLLCIVLIQVTFVSGKEVSGNAIVSNSTVSNSTVSNSTVTAINPQHSTPDIELQTSYISDTLEAGKTYVYQVQIKNSGRKSVTIEPKLSAGSPIIYPMVAQAAAGQASVVSSTTSSTAVTTRAVSSATSVMPTDTGGQVLGNNDIKISAPKTIKAGGIANMTITVTVPENAISSYYGSIDMNVNDVKNNYYNPQLGLSFTVQKPLTVPYVKTFSTTTNAPVTIDVSADTFSSDMGTRISPKIEDPSFQLGLTCNGNPVDLTLVKTVGSGSVYIGNSYPSWSTLINNNYQSYGEHYVETYTANGVIGDYELSILPKNTYNFGYSVTIGNNT